jgi:hypothetical protein
MWEGISYKSSGGLADGAWHFAAMLNKLSSIFLSFSDVENALPLVLRYCFLRMHPLYLLCSELQQILHFDFLARLQMPLQPE